MANLLAVWLRFRKQLLLNYLKRLQSLISRFVEAKVEIGNIDMIVIIRPNADSARLDNHRKPGQTPYKGYVIPIYIHTCRQTAISNTFGSTINYDELEIYCSIVKLIVKSCMEYMRISVSFTMFYKSFIFRNFERQRYKNSCTG